MKIQKYANNVESCNGVTAIESKENFMLQYKENLKLLKQHPTLEELQESLLPSMNTALPFVCSSISFSNHIFSTFLNIEKKFSEDLILSRDLEKEFSKKLSGRLDQVIDTLYHNAGIFVRHVNEHVERIGNGSAYKKALQQVQTNYLKRNLTCQDINLLGNFNKLKINMRLGKRDYVFHTKEAYKDAASILSPEIEMYKFYKNK